MLILSERVSAVRLPQFVLTNYRVPSLSRVSVVEDREDCHSIQAHTIMKEEPTAKGARQGATDLTLRAKHCVFRRADDACLLRHLCDG